MTKSLDEILTHIAEKEELSKEFSKLDEIEEIYKYCREFGLESTEEEFDEELSYFIDENDLGFELDEKEFMNIAGGVDLKKYLSKTAAMALSALTLAGTGAGMINNSHAAEYKTDNTSISVKKETVKEGKWAKTKASLKRFWNNHKKAIITTTVVTAGAAILSTAACKMNKATNEQRQKKIEEARKKEEELTKRIEDHTKENRDVICRCIRPFLRSDVAFNDALSKLDGARLDNLLRKASSKLGKDINDAPDRSWWQRCLGLKSKEQLQREKDIIDKHIELRGELKTSRLIIQSYN